MENSTIPITIPHESRIFLMLPSVFSETCRTDFDPIRLFSVFQMFQKIAKGHQGLGVGTKLPAAAIEFGTGYHTIFTLLLMQYHLTFGCRELALLVLT